MTYLDFLFDVTTPTGSVFLSLLLDYGCDLEVSLLVRLVLLQKPFLLTLPQKER